MSDGDGADTHVSSHNDRAGAFIDRDPCRGVGGERNSFDMGEKGCRRRCVLGWDIHDDPACVHRGGDASVGGVDRRGHALGGRKVGVAEQQIDLPSGGECGLDVPFDDGASGILPTVTMFLVTAPAAPSTANPPTINGPWATA